VLDITRIHAVSFSELLGVPPAQETLRQMTFGVLGA
jgi:hypothetical protein